MKDETSESPSELMVRVLKFDGTPHRLWPASLTKRLGSLLILDAAFEEEVEHSQLGLIRRGTVSIEYYWLDRWYNVFRFLEPDGSLRNFYCNICLPPTLYEGVLTYVDLDIDLLVAKDFSVEILDMEEFKDNAKAFPYPQAVQEKAIQALYELLALIKSREFPFHQSCFENL